MAEAVRRVMSLEEANALLPRVRVIVAAQIERRNAIERIVHAITQATGETPESFVEKPNDSDEVRAMKRDGAERIRAYQTIWAEIEAMGAVVKDARAGLLDFYGRVEGRLVFLCWRYDEPSIGFFHDLDTGFSARKPIEGGVLARMYS